MLQGAGDEKSGILSAACFQCLTLEPQNEQNLGEKHREKKE